VKRSDIINKTLQYLLIALGIFVFIEIQVILFVSIDNYIKNSTKDTTSSYQMPTMRDMPDNDKDSFNPFSDNKSFENENQA